MHRSMARISLAPEGSFAQALPNRPMKLPIRPQGHWCSVEGPTRRPARSLSATRWPDALWCASSSGAGRRDPPRPHDYPGTKIPACRLLSRAGDGGACSVITYGHQGSGGILDLPVLVPGNFNRIAHGAVQPEGIHLGILVVPAVAVHYAGNDDTVLGAKTHDGIKLIRLRDARAGGSASPRQIDQTGRGDTVGCAAVGIGRPHRQTTAANQTDESKEEQQSALRS